MTTPRIEEMVEEFASIEHERWSKWQKYLHSQCFKNPEFTGALIIPADLVARWERQIATPYAELSEKEKQSDREQVYPYIKALTKIRQAGRDEAVEVVNKKKKRFPANVEPRVMDKFALLNIRNKVIDEIIKALQDKK